MAPLGRAPRRRHRPAAGRLQGPPPQGLDGHDHQGLRHGQGGPLGPGAQDRRGLRHPPAGRGPHRGRLRAGRDHHLRRPPPRRGGGHRHVPGRRRARLRLPGAPPGRRGDQARAAQLRDQGGPAGGDRPQGAGRHGPRPAGHHHQAGRPPAQHADPGRPAVVEAGPHRPGDPRRLRPAGPPPRHAGPPPAARGPGLRHPAAQALRRDRPHGVAAGARARPLPHPGAGGGAGPHQGAAHRRRGVGPAQALLEHLREDGRQGPGLRRHLRPGGHPGAGRRGEGLLRRPGLHPRHLDPGPGPLQGLHRPPQVQPLPVAPHHGGGPRRQAPGGADPHPRDAQPGRGRRGRPLGLQGARLRHRRHGLAQPDRRLAAGDLRPPAVLRPAQGRPRPGRGLRLHPQGPHHHPGPGGHAHRLRLRGPHRGGPLVRRGQGERPAGVARPHPHLRRDLRDRHLPHPGRRPQAGLAADRADAQGGQQDPPVVLPRAPGGRHRDRAGGARQGPPPRGPARAAR